MLRVFVLLVLSIGCFAQCGGSTYLCGGCTTEATCHAVADPAYPNKCLWYAGACVYNGCKALTRDIYSPIGDKACKVGVENPENVCTYSPTAALKYTCTCGFGFTPVTNYQGDQACSDIDECDAATGGDGPLKCRTDMDGNFCKNLPGSYICGCGNSGYRGTGTQECVSGRIAECTAAVSGSPSGTGTGIAACAVSAGNKCVELGTGYKCNCTAVGYQLGVLGKTCVSLTPVADCAVGAAGYTACNVASGNTCNDLANGFSCTCKVGFNSTLSRVAGAPYSRVVATKCTATVNECAAGAVGATKCATSATGNVCVETASGYFCRCNPATHSGTNTQSCVAPKTCSSTGNTACKTTITGNTCAADGASFKCTCNGLGQMGTGSKYCMEKNECFYVAQSYQDRRNGAGAVACRMYVDFAPTGNTCQNVPATSSAPAGFKCTCNVAGSTGTGTTACSDPVGNCNGYRTAAAPDPITAFVNHHNYWRCLVGAPAVAKNDAMSAQMLAHLQTCSGYHTAAVTLNSLGQGENLAGTSTVGTDPIVAAKTAVAMWAGEKYNFDPAARVNGLTPWVCVDALTGLPDERGKAACGHYTQLVWAKSTQIGCAVYSCYGQMTMGCRYFPTGNFEGAYYPVYEGTDEDNNEKNAATSKTSRFAASNAVVLVAAIAMLAAVAAVAVAVARRRRQLATAVEGDEELLGNSL